MDDHRGERDAIIAAHLREQLEAGTVREPQVHDHAVERRRGQVSQRALHRVDLRDLEVAGGEQVRERVGLDLVILDDEQPAHPLRSPVLDPPDRGGELVARRWFHQIADRPELQRTLRVVLARPHVDRDVAQARLPLDALEHREARAVGEVHIEPDPVGYVLQGEGDAIVGERRVKRLEAKLVGEIDQDAGEREIVLDHEQEALRAIEVLAVVGDPVGHRRW